MAKKMIRSESKRSVSMCRNHKMSKKQMKELEGIFTKRRNEESLLKEICGKLIGSGVYRDVYELKQDPNFVVKVERDMEGTFANVTEWRNYINSAGWNLIEKWLAPCEMINGNGSIMIQQRVTTEGKRRKDYPKYVPKIFTDLKLSNFGWIGDQFVCCDYAFFVQVMIKSTKSNDWYKVAKWWGSLQK